MNGYWNTKSWQTEVVSITQFYALKSEIRSRFVQNYDMSKQVAY